MAEMYLTRTLRGFEPDDDDAPLAAEVAPLDHGPGYRVYCGQDGNALVLLLCGGDKRKQKRDIEVAHGYWQDYQKRTG